MNWKRMLRKRVKGHDERGQSIVLIVFMIIGILAFVGIAVDVGFLFARSSQFSAAVDAAALAGVVELHQAGGVNAAVDRAGEFLDANGWPISQTIEYSGTQSLTDLGIPEFSYTVTWPVETFFLGVIGFDDFPVKHSATAAYHALADMPTATQLDRGVVRMSGQYVYGPNSCAKEGDPVSATFSDNGVPNADYPIMEGTYLYRIRVPSDYVTAMGSSLLEVQLFDPDTVNGNTDDSGMLSHYGGGTDPFSCPDRDGDSCIVETGESRNANPIWLWRVDETLKGDTCPTSSWADANGATTTRFRLFYRDEDEKPIDLATYDDNGANVGSTDMKWVSPGSPGNIAANSGSFTVDLSAIPLDDDDNYNVFLEVEALNGASKNGFDIWAGSPALADTLDPYPGVNERNLWILNNYNAYDTRGVQVMAQGYMPTTVYLPNSVDPDTGGPGPVRLPIAAVDTRYGGGSIYTTPFDFEGLGNQVIFRFDSLATADFYLTESISCGADDECDNEWVDPQFAFGIPTIDEGVAFYGGNLLAQYAPGDDEHVWALRITAGRPFLTR